MTAYISKEELGKAFLENRISILVNKNDISDRKLRLKKVPVVTKAEICREFVDKVDTELMTGYWDSVDCELIISREDLRDVVKRVLAEMEQE